MRSKTFRGVPQNIMHDKEYLYSNTLQLKKVGNKLKEENQWLKAKLQQYEEELKRKDRMIEDLATNAPNTRRTANQVCM